MVLLPSALLAVAPEIILAIGILLLIIIGTFQGDKSFVPLNLLAIGVMVVTFFTIVITMGEGTVIQATPEVKTPLVSMFVRNYFTDFTKVIILVGAGVTLAMSINFMIKQATDRFEYPILVLLATLGMFAMVSAGNLITLYLGIELQSLALYVIVAYHRDNKKSTEAGLKYFVLGALSSGLLLYGCSLIYGFTGTTDLFTIRDLLEEMVTVPTGVILGMVFICVGFAFKVSAVPFHMWTPDVYEGALTSVTAFLAAAPKVAGIAMIISVLDLSFGGIGPQWQQIFVVMSIASMVLGAVAAIRQTNIKRLLAYSSIGHIGYMLMGVATHSVAGIRGVVLYLMIYIAMTIGAFACILTMRQKGQFVEDIYDMAGLAKTNPFMAAVMAIFMFSMAGIPPLAGFFAKLYVFLAAIEAGFITLAIIGVLSSVIGAFYYLRIVKIMYFDAPIDKFDKIRDRHMAIIMGTTAAFVLFFFLYPALFTDMAQNVAHALMNFR